MPSETKSSRQGGPQEPDGDTTGARGEARITFGETSKESGVCGGLGVPGTFIKPHSTWKGHVYLFNDSQYPRAKEGIRQHKVTSV